MRSCKLCGHQGTRKISPPEDVRNYFLCDRCNLIFVGNEYLPSRQQEIDRYLEHNNNPEDKGYVDFLNRMLSPSLRFMDKEMKSLDYGCGYNPVFSGLLEKKGFTCYNYDPLFGFDHPLDSYDFIFAIECFEHFFEPVHELNNIGRLLKTGGFLGIMTERWESVERFNSWYYKRDFTHVIFFHLKTLGYICENYGYEIAYLDRNRVAILKHIGC
jgi:SAM-dependent methyltransferase